MLQMMEKNGYENPFYTHFDELLKISKEYDVAISLGPCYRPASVCDCDINDPLTQLELKRMAELCQKAIDYGVGIFLDKKSGEYVKEGETLCTIYSNDESKTQNALNNCLDAFLLSDTENVEHDLIYRIIK